MQGGRGEVKPGKSDVLKTGLPPPLGRLHGGFQAVEELRAVGFAEGFRAAGDFAAFAQVLHQLAVGQRHADAVLGKRLAVGFEGESAAFQTPRRQRDVAGDADVGLLNVLGDPVVGGVRSLFDNDQFDQRASAGADAAIADQTGFQAVPGGDAKGFVLDRTGVGIDVNDRVRVHGLARSPLADGEISIRPLNAIRRRRARSLRAKFHNGPTCGSIRWPIAACGTKLETSKAKPLASERRRRLNG